MVPSDIIQSVLNDSRYDLTLFTKDEVATLWEKVFTKTVRGKEIPHITCIVRDKKIQLRPEEIVRQLYATRLIEQYGYPKKRLAFEYPSVLAGKRKTPTSSSWIKTVLIPPTSSLELKKPKLKDGKNQLRSYCNATGAPIGVWTNGAQISHYHRVERRVPRQLGLRTFGQPSGRVRRQSPGREAVQFQPARAYSDHIVLYPAWVK